MDLHLWVLSPAAVDMNHFPIPSRPLVPALPPAVLLGWAPSFLGHMMSFWVYVFIFYSIFSHTFLRKDAWWLLSWVWEYLKVFSCSRSWSIPGLRIRHLAHSLFIFFQVSLASIHPLIASSVTTERSHSTPLILHSRSYIDIYIYISRVFKSSVRILHMFI